MGWRIRLGATVAVVSLSLITSPAMALDGADGADGSGHDGTTGDSGGSGGVARTISGGTGDTTLGAGNMDTGGTGGDGRGLTAADARSESSSTLGIDGTAPLAGQAGIAAGDSIDFAVDGTTTTITIGAGETLSDIAAEIQAAFPTLDVSATTSGSNDVLTIGQGGTVIERFTATNNNNTPLTALGFSSPPVTITELFADGGAGADGGVAVLLDATSDDTLTNLGTITGGAGGIAGGTLYRAGDGGDGGDGGAGVRADAGSVAILINSGTIAGGAGGTGGAGGIDGTAGSHGAGGVGVTGAGMTVVNSGSIAGGLGGDGATRADAIQFTGGVNTLTLEAGSTITGNVVAFSAADTLALGGSTNASFNVSQIGGAVQYRGFGIYEKTGTGTWTLTGTTGATTPWTVSSGTLNVGADGALGASTGGLTFDGGRLQWGASFDLSNSRTITLNGGGGTLDTNGFTSTLSQGISGTGTLTKTGAGTLMLSGASTYTGDTIVNLGTLTVNGSIGVSATTVSAGGTLGGSGTVGTTVVASGGTLAPGNSVGMLTVAGDLTLVPGSLLKFELGTPGPAGGAASGISDRVTVDGNLTLDGTLDLAQSGDLADGAAGLGYYRLMTYGGSLTDNGLEFGTKPALSDPANYQIQAGSGNVDLFIGATGDDTLQHWQGGDGTWDASTDQWLNQGSGVSVPWASNYAAFKNDPGDFDGGTIAVEGSQSFKGLQFVDSGYRLEGSGTLEVDGSVSADGNAEIRVLAGETAEVATTIIGSGGITKTQGGTLVLEGDNSYQGGTRIADGTLQVSADANLGAASGGLTLEGGVLQVTGTAYTSTGRAIALAADGGIDIADAANVFRVDGVISGTGALTKAGVGTLTLTAANTYTGGTLVNAGTLQVGDGGATGSIVGDVEIASAGTLAFHRDNSFTFAGVLAGGGAVDKLGAGMLTLTGDSSAFTGMATVEAGTLAVNGTLGGTIDVLDDGTLGGSGTVGTTSITSGGTIAPGNSIGTLTVDGDITFAAGSTYEAEIRPALGSDLIDASGAVTINGGTVHAMKAAGVYTPGSRWTIIGTDGAVTGTFDGLTQNMPFVELALGYDASHVYIDAVRNQVAFCDVARTDNQCATGGGLESTGVGTAVYDALAAVPDEDGARQALNALSGEIHGSTRTVLMEDSRFVREAIMARVQAAFGAVAAPSMPVMAYGSKGHKAERGREDKSAHDVTSGAVPVAADTQRFAVWAQGFGSWGQWDGDDNAAGLDRSIGGLLFGADGTIAESWRVGLLAGYSRSSFDVDERASSSRADSYHLGGYGGTQWGRLGFRTGAAYTWHKIDTDRSVLFPGFAERLEVSHDAATLQVFGEFGYRIDTSVASFEPFAGLAYVNLDTNGFTEEGGAAMLTGQGGTTDTAFNTLGLRAATAVTAGGQDLTLHAAAGWRHAFGDVSASSLLSFQGGAPFSVTGVPLARDAAVLKAGFALSLSTTARIGLSYNGQIASETEEHGLDASLRIHF